MDYFFVIIIPAAFLLVVMLGLIIYLLVSLSKLKNRMDRFMGTRSDRYNLENMILEYMGRVNQVDDKYEDVLQKIDDINLRMENCIQKVAVVRYNPFDNMGSDLSFALCLLDEHNNGFVINTIHGREASYTYAKPIFALDSSYALSSEEKRVLRMASEKKDKTMHNRQNIAYDK